jgi:hypothetical protein
MPISVVCPGCKARFSVNEKFAGKQGPCPKCKKTIKIPEFAAEAVEIHAPEEFAGGGKDAKGKLVGKPIAHEDVKFSWAPTLVMGAAVVAVFALAFVIRVSSPGNLMLSGLGLALISTPLCAALYSVLRDTERPPHRGLTLWIRSAICGATYALLWGFVAAGNEWFPEWTFLVVPLLSLGAIAAFACFEFDFGTAAIHFGFFLAITMALRWIIGIPPVWQTIELPFLT